MKTKITMNSIVKVSLCMISWIVLLSMSNVFGASSQSNHDNPSTLDYIINTGCIEYTLPSWLTGRKCDDVSNQYQTGNVQWPEFFIQKRQKTWSMTSFTTWDVFVQSGEYIQYKVDFGSITWVCKNGTIEDRLPSCVKYVSSSIVWVTSSTLTTGEHLVQYTNFRLNSGITWYILVTGQIIANTENCMSVTRYVNTWTFRCKNPQNGPMSSSVVARRNWWWNWSNVTFTKSWNKTWMHLGESWLVFTLTVYNAWPNSISGIVINDIWPEPRNCIILDRWYGQNWQQSWHDYIWRYVWWKNGTLWPDKTGVLKLYASVSDDPSCVWNYINTWVMTYNWWWPLYGDHPFVVTIDGPTYDDISIRKTVEPQIVSHWQEIVYTISYHNDSDKPLTEYTIKDEWPSWLVFIRSDKESRRSWNYIVWEHLDPLQGNSTGTITIRAKVE